MQKNKYIFKFIFYIIFLSACSSKQEKLQNLSCNENVERIQIISDFEKGSIGSLKQISENSFSGQPMHWIKNDKIGNQFYWFYFQAVNVKDKELHFQFRNLSGIYRNTPIAHYTSYTQPVISYDKKHWERVTEVSYSEEKKEFWFTVNFKENIAWIAYAHPYLYSQGLEYLEEVKTNKNIKIITIGNSTEGRAIHLAEITNFEKENSNKKNVLTMSLQHGGEDCGGYFSEGMIDFLLSENLEAQEVRDNFRYFIILVMNPDGLYHGITRYTANMEDLNVEWDDNTTDTTNLPLEPEVVAVKNWINSFYDGGEEIDMFMDIHGQSQKWTGNAFWDKSNDLKKLVEINQNMWPLKHFHSKSNSGTSSTSCLFNEFGISSATLELTQSYADSVEHHYLEIKDYRFFGESFVKSVNEFFK